MNPAIHHRSRIEICDPAIPGSKQPYHYAAELDLPNAQRHLHRCFESSRQLAFEAIEKFKVSICAMGIGSGRPLKDLQTTLASHAAIHTAEGEFFRDAIAEAVKLCALECKKYREKDLAAQAKELLAIREMIGPPWTQDQKFAALAGWLALAPQTK
jgi:hypothetical protein